ncbi:MAG: hypothetical protein ABI683_14095 [Ginsengibacter sp.]
MLLKRIDVTSDDVGLLSQYYREVLELPVKQVDVETISIVIGNSEIVFSKANSNEKPFYHFAFNIPGNKFEEALKWVQLRSQLLWLDDYKSYVADFKNWNAKSFYFTDPCGNILEFIARFDLQDDVKETFSSKHLRNVSEIGLVFPQSSFDSEVKNLVKEYNLTYFAKQPPLEYFRAIGDDEGLFICVPENRHWFSTENSACIFPLSILFIDRGKEHKCKMYC